MKKMTRIFPALLLLTLLFLSSCTHLIKLDYAQRNFSEAATIENKAVFSETLSTVSAENYYRLAYAQVKDAIKGANEKRLKDDGVYVNAMTIKALCEWKLGKYEESRKTAESAVNLLTLNSTDQQIISRDVAILESMDALTSIEEVYKAIGTQLGVDPPLDFAATKSFYETWVRNLTTENTGKLVKAIHEIDMVKAKLPPKHEVRRYLTLSQLTAIKNWKYALDRMNNNAKKLSGQDQQDLNALRKLEQSISKTVACDYLTNFGELFPNGNAAKGVQYWYYLLGVNLDDCEDND